MYKCAHLVFVRFFEKEVIMTEKLTITTKKFKGETSTITTRLPVELIAKIDDAAKKTGRNRNDIVQKCIEFAMNNLEISEG